MPRSPSSARVYDELALDGVMLLSNVAGTYLGDPALEPLLAALDERAAYVFVHPGFPPHALPLGHPVWLYEFPFETVRATTNLIYSGAFERHQRIRWQLSHLGGAAPFLAHRLASLAEREPALATAAPAGALAYLRRLYYDTGLANNGPALAATREVTEFGPRRVRHRLAVRRACTGGRGPRAGPRCAESRRAHGGRRRQHRRARPSARGAPDRLSATARSREETMGTVCSRGRIAIVGAGPAGMATALAATRAGFTATILERHPEVKPAGNILNLWPPPQKVLGLLGVDIDDLGAPGDSEFRRADGRVRARVRLPQDVKLQYGGGFIGLLRPGLYRRMLDALPPGTIRYGHDVTSFTDTGQEVTVNLRDREPIAADVLVGADGINSVVRRGLWGEQPIRHQKLHLVAGYLFCDAPEPVTIVAHNRRTQGSYSAIRHDGRSGYEWWVLEAFDPSVPFTEDLRAYRAAPRPRLRRAAAVADPRHTGRAPVPLGDPRP